MPIPIPPPSLPKSDTIKNVGIGIGVLVLSEAGYNFYREYKNKNENGTEENKKKNINAIKIDATKLTKEPIVYQNTADELYNTIKRNGITYTTPQMMTQILSGFNDDELKQIFKDFGVRSFNTCWICDKTKYTMNEFVNKHVGPAAKNEVARIYKNTGLIVVTLPPKTTYLNDWYNTNLRLADDSTFAANKPVYSTRTGSSNLTYLDSAWWDYNSWKNDTGRFTLRPADATTPLGVLLGHYRASNGYLIVRIRVIHPNVYTSNGVSVLNRELWLSGERLTFSPYNPPLNGLGNLPLPSLPTSLNLA